MWFLLTMISPVNATPRLGFDTGDELRCSITTDLLRDGLDGLANRTQPEIGRQTDGGEGNRQPGSRIVEHRRQRKAEHQNDGCGPKILIGDGESDCRQKDGACDDRHRGGFLGEIAAGEIRQEKTAHAQARSDAQKETGQDKLQHGVVADRSADRPADANCMPASNPQIPIRQRQCRRLHGYFLGVAILFRQSLACPVPGLRFFVQCRNRLELA